MRGIKGDPAQRVRGDAAQVAREVINIIDTTEHAAGRTAIYRRLS
jgi:hypothetical protein